MHRSALRLSLFLASFASLSTLCGCASGKVNLVRTAPPPNAFDRSQLILVGDFNSGGATSLGDGHESEEVVGTQLGRLSEDIETRVVKHLQAKGFNAQRLAEAESRHGAIIVDGDITLNDRGSWAMRVFVGFGTGATRLESTVRAHRAGSTSPLAEFDVQATSGSSSSWMGTGDFIPTDSENTAIAIANYIAEQAGGGSADPHSS